MTQSRGEVVCDLPTLEFLHPFYVASDLPDLDAAFEDGKVRALRTLERRAAMVRAAARSDYEAAFLGKAKARKSLGVEG